MIQVAVLQPLDVPVGEKDKSTGIIILRFIRQGRSLLAGLQAADLEIAQSGRIGQLPFFRRDLGEVAISGKASLVGSGILPKSLA